MTGHLSSRRKEPIYDLRLKSFDPSRRYFIVADLASDTYNAPPDQPGSKGFVTMRLLPGATAGEAFDLGDRTVPAG